MLNIVNSLRAHFTKLKGQTFRTLPKGAAFDLVRVDPEAPQQRATWILGVQPEAGKQSSDVYYSDVLRVYAWLCDQDDASKWRTPAQIPENDLVRISPGSLSYLLPLLATLDGVHVREVDGQKQIRVQYPEH